MNERIKAKELFNKGLDLYNEKKYEAAYNLFSESLKLDYKETTEIYMIRSKKQLQNQPTSKSNAAPLNKEKSQNTSSDPEKV